MVLTFSHFLDGDRWRYFAHKLRSQTSDVVGENLHKGEKHVNVYSVEDCGISIVIHSVLRIDRPYLPSVLHEVY